MPIYEFKCEKCGNVFEELKERTFEIKEVKCPRCGEQKARKLFSSFAASSKSKEEKVSTSASSCCSGGFCGCN